MKRLKLWALITGLARNRRLHSESATLQMQNSAEVPGPVHADLRHVSNGTKSWETEPAQPEARRRKSRPQEKLQAKDGETDPTHKMPTEVEDLV
jgi:hypothetical protein